MSLCCADVRLRFAPYAAEELSAPERRAVREHLAACGACRAEAAAADPTLLFAEAGPAEAVSAADAARILEGVRAAVALEQAERRLSARSKGGRRARNRTGAVAAAAAVALFTMALPGGFSQPPAAAPAAAVTPVFGKTSAFARASAERSAKAPSGATVYEIAPGAGPDEPRVVWIVDGSLDI